MTSGYIAIKGDHLEKNELFEVFKYEDLKQDIYFNNWEGFVNYVYDHYVGFADREISLRGFWYHNGWTVIFDPELVDTVDEDALIVISAKLKSEVLTFMLQKSSASFGFARYAHNKQRHFFSMGGEVAENIGSACKEEERLNLNEKIQYQDLLKLADNFGIDLEGKGVGNFIVKQLGYSEELKKELAEFSETKQVSNSLKPWWRFW